MRRENWGRSVSKQAGGEGLGKGRAPRKAGAVPLQGPGPPKSPGMGVRVQLPGWSQLCRAPEGSLPVCSSRKLLQPRGEQLSTQMSPHVAREKVGMCFCHCHGNGDRPPLLSSPPKLRESVRPCGEPGGGMVGEQSPSSGTQGDTCTGNSAWHHLGLL